jgi:hypothetical protein
MGKKYELTTDTKIRFGRKLFRIKALVSFGNVKAGELGGYVEDEKNLSQNGDAWVCDNAEVCDNARVCGNAWVCGNARVCDNADYVCAKGLGSACRSTTFFKCKNGDIGVACGCFNGNLEEFAKKVKDTHGDSKYAKEYLAMIEVVKIHFEWEDNDDNERGV